MALQPAAATCLLLRQTSSRSAVKGSHPPTPALQQKVLSSGSLSSYDLVGLSGLGSLSLLEAGQFDLPNRSYPSIAGSGSRGCRLRTVRSAAPKSPRRSPFPTNLHVFPSGSGCARGGDGGNGYVNQSSQGRTAKAGLTLAMEEQLVMSFLSALGRSGISVACSITRKLAKEAMDFLRIT